MAQQARAYIALAGDSVQFSASVSGNSLLPVTLLPMSSSSSCGHLYSCMCMHRDFKKINLQKLITYF
jgi:phosphoribosylcarboxyaminoimidazole (NCAIR) mutase